ALIDAVTAAFPSPPLPPLPPSLYIPPPVDHRDDIPKSEQPPRKRLYLSTLGSRYEVEIGESSTARPTRGQGIDYGFVSTHLERLVHERDTQDLYALLEDAQDSRSRISQRVDMNSQRVDLLMGDRMTLQEIVWMVEEEAYASREAWAHSIGLSQATHLSGASNLLYSAKYMRLVSRCSRLRWQRMVTLRESDRRSQEQMAET
ncbi:hypothetical protein Tco_0175758, partial [Tanacetum coccineum]